MFVSALHRRRAFGAADYPAIESSQTHVDASATDSRSITLPSGVQTGDLLVFLGTMTGQGVVPTFDTHSGWTALASTSATYPAAEVTACAIYRVATGSDDLTLVTSHSKIVNGITLRISGQAAASFIAAATANSGADTSDPIDPPELSHAGSAKRLWLVLAGWSRKAQYMVSGASGYTEAYYYDSAANTIASVYVGWREAEAAAETPGDIDLSGPDPWAAITVAITP